MTHRQGQSAQPDFQLQPLESRRLLSITYHGGAMLGSVEVQPIYFGTQWAADPALQNNASQLDRYLSFLVDSAYMDLLSQYSAGSTAIGRGIFLGRDPANPALSESVIDEAEVQAMLRSQLAAGNIRTPDGSTLYIVYLPPGVQSSGDFAGGYIGHHSFFTDSGNTFYYAVIPYPGPPNVYNARLNAWTAFEQQTDITSHELAEAVTDPDLMGGWYDENSNEVADLANLIAVSLTAPDGTHYVVQDLWSLATQSPAAPAGASFFLTGGKATLPRKFNGVIGTFHDADAAQGDAYTATLFWSDGEQSSAAVKPLGGGDFGLTLSRSFGNTAAASGNYWIIVSDTDGASARFQYNYTLQAPLPAPRKPKTHKRPKHPRHKAGAQSLGVMKHQAAPALGAATAFATPAYKSGASEGD